MFRKLDLLPSSGAKKGKDPTQLSLLDRGSLDHWASRYITDGEFLYWESDYQILKKVVVLNSV
jgi:hypothetical protein